MKAEDAKSRYLGVACQHCGEPIPVPERLMSRQILVQEDASDPASRYVSTLLNLRCKACHREYFYDVGEISEYEGTPRHSHGVSHHQRSAPFEHHRRLVHHSICGERAL